MIREQTFRGEGAPALVVDGPEVFEDCTFVADDRAAEVLVVRGDVTLRRCRVEGGNNRGVEVHSGRVLIEDCTLARSRVGVFASAPAEVTVRRCVADGLLSVGVLLRRGAIGTVEDCTLLGIPDAAVMLRSDARGWVRRCELSSANVGLHLDSWADVSQCHIHHARVGVWVGPGVSDVRDCRIEDCFSIGMYFIGPALVERCNLVRNHIGLCLYEGGDPRIVDCRIEDGDNMGVFGLDGGGGLIERCVIGPHPNGAKVLLPGATTRFTD